MRFAPRRISTTLFPRDRRCACKRPFRRRILRLRMRATFRARAPQDNGPDATTISWHGFGIYEHCYCFDHAHGEFLDGSSRSRTSGEARNSARRSVRRRRSHSMNTNSLHASIRFTTGSARAMFTSSTSLSRSGQKPRNGRLPFTRVFAPHSRLIMAHSCTARPVGTSCRSRRNSSFAWNRRAASVASPRGP